MSEGRFIKDPAAKLDYAVDWSSWLSEDTISAVVWSVTGSDAALLVASSPAPSEDAGVATVWVEAGTLAGNYYVTCQITTAGGRVDQRSFEIRVRDL